MKRWIELEGCDNFRDVGGYRTSDGQTTRWETLYRSDALGRLTDSAVNNLKQSMSIRTVIDLRTSEEIDRLRVPAWIAEVQATSVSLGMANPEIEAIRLAGAGGMGELYLWDLEAKREVFAAIVRLLSADTNLPAVIQCNGGKDRTGITIALLLDLLGVPDETIIDDYVLTDEVRSRVPAERYERAVADLVAADLDPGILGARRETMVRFLAGFRERWTSAEEYAIGGGATLSVIRSVRRILLEPSS